MSAVFGKIRWRWMALVGMVLLAAVGVWMWKANGHGTPQYTTTPVERGDLTQVVTATGQLNPVISVQVGSQISGTIKSLLVDFNTPVQKGQIIAEMDPATYQTRILQSESDTASARAGLELAQLNAARSKELLEANLIPPSDFDEVTARLHQAEALLKQKEASLANARVDLSRCTIYSPIDGIVIDRKVDVGQTVAASLSAPTLFIIANDLTKMRIEADVAEADIGGIEAGQEVEFTVDAFPYRTFRGQVMQIRNAPATVQNVVTYDVIIAVANPDLKLKVGMTANVSIMIAQRTGALKIPNAALRFRPTTPTANGTRIQGSRDDKRPDRKRERSSLRTVHLLGAGGQLQSKEIKTGITDGLFTEVLEGLQEGDRVITGMVSPSSDAARTQSPFGTPMPRRF